MIPTPHAVSLATIVVLLLAVMGLAVSHGRLMAEVDDLRANAIELKDDKKADTDRITQLRVELAQLKSARQSLTPPRN
jgi:galactose-1-phosphate uridylyltransferase